MNQTQPKSQDRTFHCQTRLKAKTKEKVSTILSGEGREGGERMVNNNQEALVGWFFPSGFVLKF